MNDLTEYPSAFDPNLKHEDFSKETLVKLLEEYRTLLIAINGFYQTVIGQRHGSDEAIECSVETWKMYARLEMKRIARILKIEERNVETFFKVLQFAPAGSLAAYDFNIDIKDPNLGIMTIDRCSDVEWMEKNAPERIAPSCQRLERTALETYAQAISPEMKVTPLKIPPRKGPDDVPFCQWEFKLEAKSR